MSQPLLRVVCLFALGVVLEGIWDLGLSVWLIALLIFSIAAPGMKRSRPVTLPLLLICAGGINLSWHTRAGSPHDLRHQVSEAPILAELQGRLVETPRITFTTRGGQVRPRTVAQVDVTQLKKHHGQWAPATGRVLVSSGGVLENAFFQGQPVQISGVLSKPDTPLADGLFDYASYLRHRGIHFQLRAGSAGNWSLVGNPSTRPPFTDRFVRWSRQTLSRGLPEEDPATGLLQAMTLGWKTALTDEIEAPFMKSGTMHVFAISGLHIALIGGIILSLFRLIRIPRGACGVLLIPMLWFYTAATGWQASAIRATLMMTVLLAGWSLKRPSNLLNSLAAAALLILLFDPRQIYQVSFQLSFAVVLSLSLLLPPLQERLLRLLEPDPMLPAQLEPRWRQWLGKPMRWVLLTLATSCAAWIGSMPLAAHCFHLFTPATLLANVLLLPCAAAALASALASLTTGGWWPWLSEVFNHGAWFWMRCMMQLSERISELPGAYRYVTPPSPAVLLLYYGTMLVMAFGVWSPRQLKRLLTASALLLAGLLLWQAHVSRSSAALTVLPLHGGMAVHFKPPASPESTLIDCGNTNAFESVLGPFMRARGENRIRTLILTHGDVRHMGAAALVVKDFSPTEVGISCVPFRSNPYRRLMEGIHRDHGSPTQLSRGNHFRSWEVLHPPANLKVPRADEGALVLRTCVRGTSVLLLSDLDRTGQRRLLDLTHTNQLRADIVVTGLPGKGEPLIPDLLQQVHPALIVVCDDERPAHRRASPGLLARLKATGTPVLNTRETGSVSVEFTDQGWTAVNADRLTLAESGVPPGKDP